MGTEPRVLLTFEDGDIIVAKRFRCLDGDLMGIAAACDDGSRKLFAVKATPTNAEFYGIEVAADASYEEKCKAAEEALEELDDRGDDVPDISTPQLLDAWLNAEAEMDEYQMESWGAETASQYAPGLILMEQLTLEEQQALGLRWQDNGGPASSVPCATTQTATIEELNAVMAQKNLPFLFIDKDGPEQLEA